MVVEPAHPPAAMMRVSNPVMRGLLRSPVGGPMRRQFMVLRFFGRKTGRRDDIPVVAHRLDGELYALTDAPWRNNFRDGADAEVTLDGHVTRMRGQLLDDPEAVAPLYARAIDHFGVKRAQRMLGLKIHTPVSAGDRGACRRCPALPPGRYPAHRQNLNPILDAREPMPAAGCCGAESGPIGRPRPGVSD